MFIYIVSPFMAFVFFHWVPASEFSLPFVSRLAGYQLLMAKGPAVSCFTASELAGLYRIAADSRYRDTSMDQKEGFTVIKPAPFFQINPNCCLIPTQSINCWFDLHLFSVYLSN
ncbi:hypothetical protein ILYODFUR_027959 [Ilyodon furcidens]|uniref:Uncharacterized protein n=1 Tax=Ilyodon furcidens TaxID=33524 RepID=A0ABV0TPW8_9TELE